MNERQINADFNRVQCYAEAVRIQHGEENFSSVAPIRNEVQPAQPVNFVPLRLSKSKIKKRTTEKTKETCVEPVKQRNKANDTMQGTKSEQQREEPPKKVAATEIRSSGMAEYMQRHQKAIQQKKMEDRKKQQVIEEIQAQIALEETPTITIDQLYNFGIDVNPGIAEIRTIFILDREFNGTLVTVELNSSHQIGDVRKIIQKLRTSDRPFKILIPLDHIHGKSLEDSLTLEEANVSTATILRIQ